MTKQLTKTAILCGAVLAVLSTGALAKGGKEFYVQDYQFDQPMKGYEGQAGNYYCSYQRLPNRVCSVELERQRALQDQGLDAAPALLLRDVLIGEPRRGLHSVAPLRRPPIDGSRTRSPGPVFVPAAMFGVGVPRA